MFDFDKIKPEGPSKNGWTGEVSAPTEIETPDGLREARRKMGIVTLQEVADAVEAGGGLSAKRLLSTMGHIANGVSDLLSAMAEAALHDDIYERFIESTESYNADEMSPSAVVEIMLHAFVAKDLMDRIGDKLFRAPEEEGRKPLYKEIIDAGELEGDMLREWASNFTILYHSVHHLKRFVSLVLARGLPDDRGVIPARARASIGSAIGHLQITMTMISDDEDDLSEVLRQVRAAGGIVMRRPGVNTETENDNGKD